MQEDKLTDLEQLAYYKKLYKSRVFAIIIFSILFFLLGFLAAKFWYHDIPAIMPGERKL